MTYIPTSMQFILSTSQPLIWTFKFTNLISRYAVIGCSLNRPTLNTNPTMCSNISRVWLNLLKCCCEMLLYQPYVGCWWKKNFILAIRLKPIISHSHQKSFFFVWNYLKIQMEFFFSIFKLYSTTVINKTFKIYWELTSIKNLLNVIEV